jgi:hypothetical protein
MFKNSEHEWRVFFLLLYFYKIASEIFLNLNDMKTKFLLIPLMGLSILTGCKDDEKDWDETIRESYNYKVSINIEQGEGTTTTIKAALCYPIEVKGNFSFDGNAYDLLLSKASQNKAEGDEVKKAIIDIKAPGGYWQRLDPKNTTASYKEDVWNVE